MEKIFFALFVLCLGSVKGYSRFRREIPNGYGVQHPCPGKGHWDAVGHMTGGYTPRKNVFGEDFRDGGKTWSFDICRKDSDGDGLTNGEELGDPNCKWKPGDPAPGPVRGHPGFCEPDRAKCDSGMTHPECPNPHASGRGSMSSPVQRLPPGANDHPQTFLSKNLQSGGGSGQSFGQSGFGDFGSMRPFNGGASMSTVGSFSGGFTRSPGGSQVRPQDQFGSPPGQGFRGFTGMSRDFGMSDSQFLGAGPDGSFQGGSDFSMMGPDRFRSSLDQRAIQGSGFPSSMSSGDVDRSVQARLDRERSRFGGSMGGTGSFGSMDASSSFMGPGDMSSQFPSGMGSFSSSFMGRGGEFPFGGGPSMSGGPGLLPGPSSMMSGVFRPF